jgi:hypothetical protein
VALIDENKRLIISNDSTSKLDTVGFTLNSKTKRKITIDFRQHEKSTYTLTVPDSTFLDIFGWWNKKFSYKWLSDANENYGNIIMSLKIENTEKNYVFKLLDQDNNVVETFFSTGVKERKITFKNAKAGQYHLQAIEDRNNNGIWDSGNFNQKLQPEKIINFRETYDLKGNWDLEVEVRL